AVSYKAGEGGEGSFAGRMARESVASNEETVGVDVYLDWTGGTANDLGALVSRLSGDGLKLSAIANRGVRVYPDGSPETFCSDHWRCRFISEGGAVTHEQIAGLLSRFAAAGLDFIKTESLCRSEERRVGK